MGGQRHDTIRERDFASYCDYPGVEGLGVRQVLFADTGMDTVGSHEYIRTGAAAILEMDDDPAVRSFFKTHKSLVEFHVIFQACQQNSPQGDAADRTMARDCVTSVAVAAQEFVQLLRNDAEALREVA